MKKLLIKLGILSEPSLDSALAWATKGVKKLEDVINHHSIKADAAAALAAAKAEEARIATAASQQAEVVLGNFKKLLNM